MPGLFIATLVAGVLLLASIVFWVVARKQAKAAKVEPKAQAAAEQPLGVPSGFGPPPNSVREAQREQEVRDATRRAKELQQRSVIARWVVIGLTVLTVGLLFGSSAAIVSTKNVGVITSFGAPVGNLSNGFHIVAPWQEVTEMDAAIQTDSHVQGGEPNCVTVRIAHQATACVDVSIRWRIKENEADSLFQDYRDFANVRDSLVTRQLNASLNAEFESYDPLAVDTNGNATTPSLESLSTNVTTKMQGAIQDKIDVLSVVIPVVHFDDSTQQKVNALQGQIAQTRIAEQAKQTALKQAEANKALADSVSNDPNVLVSQCFDLLNELSAKGQSIPIGFSCWPGSGSAVVVPGVSSSNQGG